LERDRFTVTEAAKVLGISESAIRKRVSRNQIEYEREEDGRLYVYLSSRDRVADTVRDELVNELRDRLAFLERELDDRKEESRRKDTIIAQLTQRIPAIEAPSEDAPESPPSPGPSPGYPTPQDAQRGPQEGTEPPDRGDVPGDHSEAQEERLARHKKWENRVLLVLGAIVGVGGLLLLAVAVLTP
jgi:excisionase family DNA binding protein